MCRPGAGFDEKINSTNQTINIRNNYVNNSEHPKALITECNGEEECVRKIIVYSTVPWLLYPSLYNPRTLLKAFNQTWEKLLREIPQNWGVVRRPSQACPVCIALAL